MSPRSPPTLEDSLREKFRRRWLRAKLPKETGLYNTVEVKIDPLSSLLGFNRLLSFGGYAFADVHSPGLKTHEYGTTESPVKP